MTEATQEPRPSDWKRRQEGLFLGVCSADCTPTPPAEAPPTPPICEAGRAGLSALALPPFALQVGPVGRVCWRPPAVTPGGGVPAVSRALEGQLCAGGGRKGPAGRVGELPGAVHGGQRWGAPVPESGCRVWLGGGPSREQWRRQQDLAEGCGRGSEGWGQPHSSGAAVRVESRGAARAGTEEGSPCGGPKNVLGVEPKVCSVLSR